MSPAPGLAVGRGALLVMACGGAALAFWAAAATWMLVARGDLSPGSFARETELRYAYEDRVGRLSDRLEREVTKNLVERNGLDARLASIVARQAEIEARQAWLRTLAGNLKPTGASGAPLFAPAAASPSADGGVRKPAPVTEEDGFRLRDVPSSDNPVPSRATDRLSRLEQAVETTAAEDRSLLETIGRATRTRVAQLRAALDATGVDIKRAPSAQAMGGPLVPLPAGTQPGQFDFLTKEIDLTFAELRHLKSAAEAIPVGLPLTGELERTSDFGYRIDPFTRGPALHTGVDFRAEPGTPARATGAGTVVSADYAGGYGQMVEVDHGGGLSTRYGHLGSFAVRPGQHVETGQILGRTGSTGRSTGPHLHYETRINGEPVNPARFLAAGRMLAGLDR